MKRVFSVLLCMAMLIGLLPAAAFSEETDSSEQLCADCESAECELCEGICEDESSLVEPDEPCESIKKLSVSCSQITSRIENYISAVQSWSGKTASSNGRTLIAYWNKHIRSSCSYSGHPSTVSDPTGTIKAWADKGDYTSCLTLSPCSTGSNHIHANGCTSNEFGSAWQCNGFSNYMCYVAFGLTSRPNKTDPSSFSDMSKFRFYPGDIIRYDKGSREHFRFIYKVDNAKQLVYYIAGNDDGMCGIYFGTMTFSTARSGYDGRSVGSICLSPASDAPTDRIPHTHSYTTYYDAAHPHKEYKLCSCGDQYYTGNTGYVDSCSDCKPQGSCGASMTWVLDSNGTLSISGSGNMYDYDAEYAPWHDNASSIKKVTVSQNVKSIGASAFEGCTGLKTIELPASITQIGGYAFYDCSAPSVYITSLSDWLKIDFGDASNPLFRSGLLYLNSSLVENLTIPDGTTAIKRCAFEGCKSLKSVNIPTSVTAIGDYAFDSCDKINDVYYKGSSTEWEAVEISSVNSGILDAELHYAYLRSGTWGDNVSWYLDENYTLNISGEGKLKSVVSNYYDLGVEYCPWYYFEGEVIKIVVTSGITALGSRAFFGMHSVDEIELPDTLEEIGTNVFDGCSSLESIAIPANVNSIADNEFSSCSKLEQINVDSDNKFYFSYDGVLYKYLTPLTDSEIIGTNVHLIWDKTKYVSPSILVKCPIAHGSSFTVPTGVTEIGTFAFYNCEALTSVTIPRGVEKLGGFAFEYCSGLKTVSFTYDIKEIACGAFMYCNSLEQLEFFGMPSDFAAIDIAEDNDSLLGAMRSMSVYGDNNPLGNLGNYSSWVLEGSTGALEIRLMGDQTDKASPWYRWRDEILSASVYSTTFAYSPCDYRIGSYSYQDCTHICSFDVPETISEIGSCAFSGCTGLTEIKFTDKLTSIDASAFSGCTGLKTVYFSGTRSQWDAVTVGEDNAALLSADIICTADYIDSGTCGEGVLWKLYNDGELAITGAGNMADYSESSPAPWYEYRAEVLSITVDTAVTHIGSYAFLGCAKLSDVRIPDSVTSYGDYCFSSCFALKRTAISEYVTELGEGVFNNCQGLEYIEVDPANGSYCSREGVLYNKAMTVLIQHPSAKSGSFTVPETVTAIANCAFASYSLLSEVSIPTSVNSICDGALCSFSGSAVIYYFGTQEQWNQIEFGENAVSEDATLVFSTPFLRVENSVGYTTREFRVPITINRNTGIAALNFKIEYDHNKLELIGYEDGIIDDWLVGVGEEEKAVWVTASNFMEDGTVLTLIFKTREGVGKGGSVVSLSGVFAADFAETELTIPACYGMVELKEKLPGDVNGDGKINSLDLLRLKKHLVGMNVAIAETNSDVTGDNIVNSADLLRLKKHLAGFSVELV